MLQLQHAPERKEHDGNAAGSDKRSMNKLSLFLHRVVYGPRNIKEQVELTILFELVL